jgi:hypothetical protein
MTSAQALAFPEENLVGWERALYAFLVEKQRRSGSLRTVQGYSSMFQDFFGRVGRAPDKVTVQEVFIWAHGKGVSGKDPPRHRRRPDGLRVLVLPLPSAHGYRGRESLQQAGVAKDLDSARSRTIGG